MASSDDEGPSTSAPAAAAAGAKRGKATRKRPAEPEYVRQIADKKLRGRLAHTEGLFRESTKAAAKINEWLKPSDAGALEAEGMERTWRFKQTEIVEAVEAGAAAKAFDLALPTLGPYAIDFTRSGRHMLIGGARGHLAMFDWQRSALTCEVQVAETTHDVTFLHNELFFAAAQKKYVYIYDKRGIEVHCLREHTEAYRLEFLPHHFLLASIGEHGVLRYQDTSTGAIVAQHKTKLGPCDVLRQNPHNAVLCAGHGNGCVTMWSPNVTTPLVKMLAHHGPVKALAVDLPGNHLVTAGVDGQVKVWDVRTFKPLHAYFAHTPATSLEISQRGMLAVAQGRRLQIWKDALVSKQQSPYMTHEVAGGAIRGFAFAPYEDVLGIGHKGGVSTMLVPGAGEPNFDSFVANPFATRKQRQEAEVAALLDKLQPDTIVLDPSTVATLRKEPAEVQKERARAAAEANRERLKAQADRNEAKDKMKGKNRPSKRHRKKQVNVIEEKKSEVTKRMREEANRRAKAAEARQAKEDMLADKPRALHRMYK